MAIGAGMTSAIMNPLHAEAKAAVLAADVLMGTDENCAAWIRANRDPNAPAGEGGRGGREGRRRRDGTDRRTVGEHRIVFTPSGLSGTVEHGTTVLDAARRLGADLDTVCGGRGICGRCQIVPGDGQRSPKWAITVAAGRTRRAGVDRDRLPRQPPARRRSPAGLRRPHLWRRRGRHPAVQPGPPAGGAQGPRPPADHRRPVVPAVVHRGAEARARPARRRSHGRRSDRPGVARAARLCRANGAVSTCWPSLQPALDREQGAITVAIDEADRRRRRLARLRRRRLRRRRRHRVDHDRRPPLRPHVRRGARQRRAHEPADQVRRGPDEPGLVRDDEPGRRPSAHRSGAGRARRVDRGVARERGPSSRPFARGGPGRQPDHAPHRARHRPDPARSGAVHAGDQPRRRRHRHVRLDLVLPNARGLRRTVHRRPRRGRHRRRDPGRRTASVRAHAAAGRHRHQRRDRARRSRSSVRRHRARRDRRSRGRRSAPVSGPRRARSKACASIRSASSRGSR